MPTKSAAAQQTELHFPTLAKDRNELEIIDGGCSKLLVVQRLYDHKHTPKENNDSALKGETDNYDITFIINFMTNLM